MTTLTRTSQQAFDLDSLIRDADVAAAPAWAGAPLEYHETYYPPVALDAAWEQWKFENGNFGYIPGSAEARRNGAPNEEIMRAGRWRNQDTVNIYDREHNPFSRNSVTRLGL